MLIPSIRDRLKAALPDDVPPFALAFSGGKDSMSLLAHLSRHPSLQTVLHVDHGLREASAEEAEQAATLAGELGHDTVNLRWNNEGPVTGIQEKARRARYGLMGDYCRQHGIGLLVTAHHADDQAETVLMRLERATGWRGAAGMRSVSYAPVWPELAGITLIRPALELSQDELHADLDGLSPIDDPSNVDQRFQRVRARHYLTGRPVMKSDMLSLASDMQRGLERERQHRLRQMDGYHLTHEGLLRIPVGVDASTLAALPPIIGGQGGPADYKRAVRSLSALQTGKTVSLGQGCLGVWKDQTLILSRDPVAMTGRSDGNLEPTAVRREISPKPQVWDGRFIVRGESGIIQPERRGLHVGYRILYGRNVRIDNLVDQRLQALFHGPHTLGQPVS